MHSPWNRHWRGVVVAVVAAAAAASAAGGRVDEWMGGSNLGRGLFSLGLPVLANKRTRRGTQGAEMHMASQARAQREQGAKADAPVTEPPRSVLNFEISSPS